MSTTALSRRRALSGAATMGLGVPMLAACGGDAGPGVATSDVPVGGGLVLVESQVVITQPTPGEFLAFSAVCTHQGCLVSEVTETINCLCHHSTFAIDTGEVTGGPASAPLAERPITVDGDRLVLS